MKVTSYGHAAIALDHADQRLVLDPGTFADSAAAVAGARTILITHEHLDHVDAGAVRERLAEGAEVWAPAGTARDLAGPLEPDAAARVHTAVPGQRFDAGVFHLTVGGGWHALIHRDIPRVENVTYTITVAGRTLYHPGDSYDHPDVTGRLDVLFTPVAGPWMKLAEAIDFALGLDPAVVVPIHDALLSDLGNGIVDQRLGSGRTGGTYEYRRLGKGESLEL